MRISTVRQRFCHYGMVIGWNLWGIAISGCAVGYHPTTTEPAGEVPTGGLETAVAEGEDQAAALYSFNDPRLPRGPGPWFDGWYSRITDVNGIRSLAVIASFHLPQGVQYRPGMPLPGYLAVLISEGHRTRSFEAFPQNIRVLSHGRPAEGAPELATAADFEWTAPGFGSITEDTIDITIAGAVQVQAKMTNPLPWDKAFPLGNAEGALIFFPLPLHWYVSSLGSQTVYQYQLLGQGEQKLVQAVGYAHQEKTWGQTFPQGWIWLQGLGDNNQSQLALTGGRLKIGPAPITAWIAGYRSPTLSWDFRPSTIGAVFNTSIDGCAGRFQFEARDPHRTLRVEASAPIDTFASVSIPTRDGFVTNGGVESFVAAIQVAAYRHNPLGGLWGAETLIEQRTFHFAALEFGAGYQCPASNP